MYIYSKYNYVNDVVNVLHLFPQDMLCSETLGDGMVERIKKKPTLEYPAW